MNSVHFGASLLLLGTHNLAKTRSKKGKGSEGANASSDPTMKVLEGEVVPPDPEAELHRPLADGDDPDDLGDVIEVSDGGADDTELQDASEEESKRSLVAYNALDAYLAEIRRFEPLSREREHEVALDYFKTKNPF